MKNLVRMMVLAMAVTAMGGEVSRASVVDYLVTGTGLEAFNFRMDGVKVNNGLAGALHLTEQGKPVFRSADHLRVGLPRFQRRTDDKLHVPL